MFDDGQNARGSVLGRLKGSRTLLTRMATSEQPNDQALAGPGRVAADDSKDVAMRAIGGGGDCCRSRAFADGQHTHGSVLGRLKGSRTLLKRMATSEQPNDHALAAPGRVAAADSMDVAMRAIGGGGGGCRSGAQRLLTGSTHVARCWGGSRALGRCSHGWPHASNQTITPLPPMTA